MDKEISRLSFQDPDGFVFSYNDKIYRIILPSYRKDLNAIKSLSVLNCSQLVKHTEIDVSSLPNLVLTWLRHQLGSETFLTIFELDKIEFISYPWEWTPSMLQEAAEFTLDFQKYLLEKGFTLKDASFYNVDFINGKPIFIDLLSIKLADTNLYPWFAYGQFLQHFIFPLIIIKYKKFDSLQFLQAYPNGISKAEVSRHVSFSSYFSIFELFHIHLFKHLDKDQNSQLSNKSNSSINRQKLWCKQLISFATSYVKKLPKSKTSAHWVNYYTENTLADYTREKEKALIKLLDGLGTIENVVDLGANTGFYSEILLKYTSSLLSIEQDITCCEIVRQKMKTKKKIDLQWQIICNNLLYPSPAIGWLNRERKSLVDRIKSPLVTALALVHHIYFSGSIEFIQIAELFDSITVRYIIVEFIDKEDDKVLLLSKKNNTRLDFYCLENFINAMSLYFSLEVVNKICITRSLFLFRKII